MKLIKSCSKFWKFVFDKSIVNLALNNIATMIESGKLDQHCRSLNIRDTVEGRNFTVLLVKFEIKNKNIIIIEQRDYYKWKLETEET